MLRLQVINSAALRTHVLLHIRPIFHGTSIASTDTLRSMATSSGSAEQLALTNVFSEDNKRKCLDFLTNKRTGFKFQNISFAKRAAVLIPLCYDVKGQPAILYTLRSLKLNSHRGEISFPGGAADPEDNGDPIATALRETEEELGITKDQIDVWGQMSPMPTASTLMGVTPVIGYVKVNPLDPSKLKINPDEVHTAFTISLHQFCDPANWGHTQYRRGLAMPVYKNMGVYHSIEDPNHDLMVQISGSSSDDDGKKGETAAKKTKPTEGQREIKLWGLTAILTHLTLEVLLPTLYKKQIPFLKSSPSSSDSDSKKCGTNASTKHHHHHTPGGKL